ncbi:MAG: GIY-YIG nuclease family protein [Parcubacteria group bacterium]|nr:GIY-YIG nuclease family protein [Parcubacteria group bacterium]
MHTVYILRSERDGNLYIGCTEDLNKRIAIHQSGRVRSTKNRLPIKLIYSEQYEDKYEAFRIERFYKTAKGKRALKAKMKHCGIV